MTKYTTPTALTNQHSFTNFNCGEPLLNHWLQKKALKNQTSGASRTFVICHQDQVTGYYCLSAGALNHDQAPLSLRRNMPRPLPVLVLGRLAIDQGHQDKGLGSALLRDAMLRTLHITKDTGAIAILVHALSTEASYFYRAKGFIPSPLNPRILMMSLKTMQTILCTPPKISQH